MLLLSKTEVAVSLDVFRGIPLLVGYLTEQQGIPRCSAYPGGVPARCAGIS